MDTLDTLKKFHDMLHQNDGLIWYAMRGLGWIITMVLHAVVKGTETLLDNVYTLGGLVEDSQVQTIVDAVMPVAWILMAISLAIYGYQLITGTQLFKQQLFVNIMMAAALFVLLPWGITKLNTATMEMYNYSKTINASGGQNQGETTSIATQIVQNNTVDLVWLSYANWKLNATGQSNFISDDNMSYMDPVEVLRPDKQGEDGYTDYGFNKESKDILNYITRIDKDGKIVKEKIVPYEVPVLGEIKMMQPFYFRYHYNFTAIFLQLAVVGLALIATSFKIVRLFLEIAFSKVLAPFVASVDLSTGQRMKQLLKDIFMNYAALALIPIVLQFYLLANAWLAIQQYNWLVTTVIMIGMAYFLIDGPDITKKILGVDLGIQDGWKAMMGAYAATKMTAATAGGAYNVAKGIKDKLSGGPDNGLDKDSERKTAIDRSDKLNERLEAEAEELAKAELSNGIAGSTVPYADEISNSDIELPAEDAKLNSRPVSDLHNVSGTDGAELNDTATDANSARKNLTDDGVSESNKQFIAESLMTADGDVEHKDRVINDILNGNAEELENRNRIIDELLSNPDISDGTRQQLVRELTDGHSDIENKQRLINDILSNSDLSDETKARHINELLNADNEQAGNRLINELTNGQGDIENKNRLVHELFSSDDTNADVKSRLINELTNGQGDVENKQRMIQDLMNNGSVDYETKHQMINAVMNSDNLSPEQKAQMLTTMTENTGGEYQQRMISEIVNGTATDETKRQMIDAVMNNSSMTPEQKTQMLTTMTNSAGDENRQRMISEIVNGTATDETKQQMVNAVMNNSSMTPEQKTQMLTTMTNSAGDENRQRMITEVANGTASEATKQQLIQDVVASGNTAADMRVKAVQDVMGGPEDVSSKTRAVTEIISQASNDPVTQSRMVNEAINHQNDLSSKTQMINGLMNNQDITPGTKQQMVSQVVTGTELPVETKQAYINQVFAGDNAEYGNKTQLIKEIVESSYGGDLESKTQTITQLMQGSSLNPEAKNMLINGIFNDSGMNQGRAEVLTKVISDTDSGLEDKTQYINQIINKAEPVSEDRKAFVEEISNSSIDNGLKTQIIKQVQSGSSTTPEQLTQTINRVMGSDGLESNFKNNIINEISNPNSVYKDDASYLDEMKKFDLYDL